MADGAEQDGNPRHAGARRFVSQFAALYEHRHGQPLPWREWLAISIVAGIAVLAAFDLFAQ
jgi:hypothetical protein